MTQAVAFDIDYDFKEAGYQCTRDDTDTGPGSEQMRAAFAQAAGGNFGAAAELFENATRQSSSAFTGYFHAGMCWLKLNDAGPAVSLFERALELEPDNQLLRIYCGIAYHTLGLFADANQQWWAALKIEDNDTSRAFLSRFFTDEDHPERLALYPICNGKGIDVGCGFRKTHPGAIGIDLTPGGQEGDAGCVKGQQSVADIAASGDALDMIDDASLDYVVQRHNLEHYQDPVKALQEWKRVLKPGGLLGMVVPDDAVCDTIHLDKTHKHVFTQDSLERLLLLIGGFDVVHMGPLLHKWSFACIAQKMPVSGGGSRFDYTECMRLFKTEMLARQSRRYRDLGQPVLADACNRMIAYLVESG